MTKERDLGYTKSEIESALRDADDPTRYLVDDPTAYDPIPTEGDLSAMTPNGEEVGLAREVTRLLFPPPKDVGTEGHYEDCRCRACGAVRTIAAVMCLYGKRVERRGRTS